MFRQDVENLVARIPCGKVMSYGQIAALIGRPRAARQVGGIAHFGDAELPWQRVVNAKGGLASGYPGGRSSHQEHLEQEGVVFVTTEKGSFLDMDEYRWDPDE